MYTKRRKPAQGQIVARELEFCYFTPARLHQTFGPTRVRAIIGERDDWCFVVALKRKSTQSVSAAETQ